MTIALRADGATLSLSHAPMLARTMRWLAADASRRAPSYARTPTCACELLPLPSGGAGEVSLLLLLLLLLDLSAPETKEMVTLGFWRSPSLAPTLVGYKRGRPARQWERRLGGLGGLGGCSGGRARSGRGQHGLSSKLGVTDEHGHGVALPERGRRRTPRALGFTVAGARKTRRAGSRMSTGGSTMRDRGAAEGLGE